MYTKLLLKNVFIHTSKNQTISDSEKEKIKYKTIKKMHQQFRLIGIIKIKLYET